jgi:CHAD domain-containing protein
MWIATESKSARGWHLLTGQTEGATEAKTPKLRRRISAANAFREIIGETLGHLASNIAPTLRDDAEGIHQMRGALRASRAALELFEPRLDAMTAGRFDSDLRRFGRLFGFARDWSVFALQTLPAAMTELPAERLWDLKQVAETERRRTHAAVVEAVRGQDFTAMMLGLAAWTEQGCAQPAAAGDDRLAKQLATLAPSLLGRVAGFTKRREHHGSKLSAEKRHRLRKSLDKLRDDVEFFTSLFPRRAVEAYRDRCVELQAILGIANDAVVTKQLALSLVTDQRPDLAKPAAALSQWSDRRGRKSLRGFGGALRDFRAAQLFWR